MPGIVATETSAILTKSCIIWKYFASNSHHILTHPSCHHLHLCSGVLLDGTKFHKQVTFFNVIFEQILNYVMPCPPAFLNAMVKLHKLKCTDSLSGGYASVSQPKASK